MEIREGGCEREGEDAMGQRVLNDHLREQPCKFGSELKGGYALILAQLIAFLHEHDK